MCSWDNEGFVTGAPGISRGTEQIQGLIYSRSACVKRARLRALWILHLRLNKYVTRDVFTRARESTARRICKYVHLDWWDAWKQVRWLGFASEFDAFEKDALTAAWRVNLLGGGVGGVGGGRGGTGKMNKGVEKTFVALASTFFWRKKNKSISAFGRASLWWNSCFE